MTSSRHFLQLLVLAAFGSIGAFGSGCGLLFGNIKPVAEKSNDYRVMDLHKENADWTRLPASEERQAAGIEDSQSATEADPNVDISDVSYQSSKTASIISLTSTCRPRQGSAPASEFRLQEYMRQLLLGFSEVKKKEEKKVTAAGQEALESTIRGSMSGRPMVIRAVVLQRSECIYDLMFIARPDHFSVHETDFTKFVDSFRLN